ncbi:hypothetical protein TRAPUB_12316 [Trametes pubescens]|uniref:F-box domain-containing protein n=1 Tax=Trametes pubescens TaxID=154538 RepID=A0A1M2VUG5_TRAPU|nr:hypothetical protein TRAPUB_12316 [Trametes pubescens]
MLTRRCSHLPLVRIEQPSGWIHRTYAFYDGPTAPLPPAISLLPSNGATSRFLGKFDVLSLVFNAIYQDEDARRNRKQLVGLMLTTKVFFHHAAGVLWRALDDVGLGPLLDMFERIDIQADLTTVQASRTIMWSDIWNNLLYYASHIRSIRINGDGHDTEVIPTLSSLIIDHSPLLPSLKHIFWDVAIQGRDNLLYFLGPNLERLVVRVCKFSGSSAGERAFLSWNEHLQVKLLLLAPHLSRFTVLTNEYHPPTVTPEQYFRQLHRLEVGVISSCVNKNSSLAKLRAMHLQRLEFGVYFGETGIGVCWRLLSIYQFASLRSIRITSNAPHSDKRMSFKLTENFRPLLELRALQRVCLHLLFHVFDFDNEQLLFVAAAWPELVSLRLMFAFLHSTNYSIPDIRSLADVVRLCPSLAIFTVPAMEVANSPDTLDISESPKSCLRSLTIGIFFIPDNIESHEVTTALGKVFPAYSTQETK